MSDKAGDDFTTAAECAPLTAEDGRLGRVSVATVESSGRSIDDSAACGSTHNAPSPLGRNSRNPGNSPLKAVEDNGDDDVASMDAPTLMAGQAREVCLAFEKARVQQTKERQLLTQTSLQPRNFLSEVQDWKKYYTADWTPDRGSSAHELERRRLHRPALVQTGSAAGQSRVKYTSSGVLAWHMWHRDFFLTVIHQNVWKLLGAFSFFYLGSFLFFSLWWYIIWKADDQCLYGVIGYPTIFNFSVVTQQTIGYGNTGPNNCAWASLVLVIQTIFGLLLDAITIGVLFARISHPQQRARSIFMSETAVIARRDGILKLMFRIADIKTTQVVEPNVRAYLYTWGDGRHTAEGEFIPVRSEELDLGNIDGLLLLPITIEHTIDERSPLCGLTHASLQALNAEVVVTFEGTTEMGNPFMARQSYLSTEIRWGYQFVRCIHRPHNGDTHYRVDTAKFHQIEPQPELPMLPQDELSQVVVSRSKRTVPYPILGENTLVLSETMVLTEYDGELTLMFRVGDTYPNQILDPVVRAYIYRWPDNPMASKSDYTIDILDVGYDTGEDRLLLWLPVTVKHTITSASPLASWQNMSGFLADADSCIAVTIEGYMYCNAQNRMRMRIYNCFNDIKLHHRFAKIVTRPLDNADRKPRIDWSRFHQTVEVPSKEGPKEVLKNTSVRSGTRGKSARRNLKAESIRSGASVADPDELDDAATQTEQADGDSRGSSGADGELKLRDAAPSPAVPDMTDATFEGANLSSLLPHLDSESTFNQRSSQSLHRRGAPPEAFYEGSSVDFRRSNTMPSSHRRSSATQRAALPFEWRKSMAQKDTGLPEDRAV